MTVNGAERNIFYAWMNIIAPLSCDNVKFYKRVTCKLMLFYVWFMLESVPPQNANLSGVFKHIQHLTGCL